MKVSRLVVRLKRGLSRSEALKYARRMARKYKKTDYRGFTYDPETGKATLT